MKSFSCVSAVKNPPAMQETWVWSSGQEDPLEKEMATHSSILAWRIPCTEEPGGLHSMALQRVRHDWVINTFTFPLPHPCIAPSPSFSLLVTSSLFSMSVSLFLVLFTRNHNQRKLTNLITWTTALSNSMKQWVMPYRAIQDGQVMGESSDKMCSTGEGNGKTRQYSCL